MSAPAPTFDLQSHSVHSDGALSAPAVVAAAAQAGVELLSLTDHDSVDGVAEAAAEAERTGLRLVSGVEISALDVDGRDLHILGYLIDAGDERLRLLLKEYRDDRQRRAQRMAAALRELGFELDATVLEDRAAEGKSVGRPHLAQAVVSHPKNAER
ncbi:MAG: PHP domain-containing protein, partial [Solirubrobacterales bacterium]|nr:PHP domain-containing protein [Solirubrobacterales bacterium]